MKENSKEWLRNRIEFLEGKIRELELEVRSERDKSFYSGKSEEECRLNLKELCQAVANLSSRISRGL